MDSKAVAATLQKQFFFVLAGFPFPDRLHELLRLVDSRRLMYRCDYPYTLIPNVIRLAGTFDQQMPKLLTEEELKAIYHGNAARLQGDSEI